MDDYSRASFATSQVMLRQYSSSFGLASRLFTSAERPHITNIYGLVRLADEIVDSYRGEQTLALLDALEQDIYAGLRISYSTNPIVHAFISTARAYAIDTSVVKAFFVSMRMDYHAPESYDQAGYERYIYGSAEVVGLMCLRVFCNNDLLRYNQLLPGARALGSAFQKVNFLRDMASDYRQLGRYYFPAGDFDSFDDNAKASIVKDIEKDFIVASGALSGLSRPQRRAVGTAYNCYLVLLKRLDNTPAAIIKQRRIRLSTVHKFWLLFRATIGSYVRVPEAKQ